MQIIRFQDPALRLIGYLARFYPDARPDVPAEWGWDAQLVVITDVGGSGEYDVALDEAILTVEVSDPDQLEASETARTIHGLIRAWQDQEPGVYWRRTIQRPTYQPDEETRVPAYVLTVAVAFRAETVSVDPIQ